MSISPIVQGLVATLAFLLVSIPLIFLFIVAFSESHITIFPFTIKHITDAYTDMRTYSSIFDTLIFSISSAFLAVMIGTLIAFAVERTDIRFKSLLGSISIIPYMIPGPVAVLAWILLLSPRIGLINLSLMRLLGLKEPIFNIYSMAGMIFVETLHTVPLGFLLMSAAIRSSAPEFEEAAKIVGSSTLKTFWYISLKLLKPALMSTFLLTFVRQIELFVTPRLLGVPAGIWTLTSRIYQAAVIDARPELASAYALILLGLCGFGLTLYRKQIRIKEQFATITSRYRVSLIKLGKRGKSLAYAGIITYILIAAVLPIIIVTLQTVIPVYRLLEPNPFRYFSLESYSTAIKLPIFGRALSNTLILSTSASAIVMALTLMLAWIVHRSGTRYASSIVDFTVSLGLAIPALALGLGILFVYVHTPLYATLFILFIALLTRYIPTGMRYSSPAVIQVSQELEHSSRVCGATPLETFGKITFPLLLPAFISGFIHLFITSLREISGLIFLVHPGNEVLGVLLFDLLDYGEYEVASVLSVIYVALGITCYAILRMLSKHIIFRQAP